MNYRIFLILLLLIPVGFSEFYPYYFYQDQNYTCLDENILYIESNISETINETFYGYYFENQTVVCPSGCYNGRCLDPPGSHVESYFMSSIGLMFMSIIFIILGLKTNPNEAYGMLQFFFIILGIVFGVFNLWFGSHLAEDLESLIAGSSISSVLVVAYFVGLMASILYMFYGVIKWILSMFNELKLRKSKNRGSGDD